MFIDDEGKRHLRADVFPTDEYTSNGVLIVPGLKVRDYNRQETTVSADPPNYSHDVAWFDTDNGGSFDGSRLYAL